MADFSSFSDEHLDRFIASKGGVEPDCLAAVAERQKRLLQHVEQGSRQQHQELLAAQENLKTAVYHLSHPRWIDWAILIMGAIAAAAAVAALFR